MRKHLFRGRILIPLWIFRLAPNYLSLFNSQDVWYQHPAGRMYVFLLRALLSPGSSVRVFAWGLLTPDKTHFSSTFASGNTTRHCFVSWRILLLSCMCSTFRYGQVKNQGPDWEKTCLVDIMRELNDCFVGYYFCALLTVQHFYILS